MDITNNDPNGTAPLNDPHGWSGYAGIRVGDFKLVLGTYVAPLRLSLRCGPLMMRLCFRATRTHDQRASWAPRPPFDDGTFRCEVCRFACVVDSLTDWNHRRTAGGRMNE